MSSRKHFLGIYLRGMAMGAADVVPGVSGGTIAFITGIYEQLIASIKSFDLSALKVLREQGLAACWQHVNGNFLTVLFLGILTSILSLAQVITFLLDNHPLVVWAFFFGLILASAIFLAQQLPQWRMSYVLALIIGVVVAVFIAMLKPAQVEMSYPVVFVAGSIAICAMILPGISGSFLLLLMGLYQPIMGAIKAFDLPVLMVFAMGCGLGLLAFSHLLHWLLSRFHDHTMSVLTGFLLGSLTLVWPWKHVVTSVTKSSGEVVPLEQKNVLPWQFEQLTDLDSQLTAVLIMAIIGFALVFILEKVAKIAE